MNNFGRLIFEHFLLINNLSHFGQISAKNFGSFAEIVELNLRLHNTSSTAETTSVKIIVLLHPQGFRDTLTRNTNSIKPLSTSSRVSPRDLSIT